MAEDDFLDSAKNQDGQEPACDLDESNGSEVCSRGNNRDCCF